MMINPIREIMIRNEYHFRPGENHLSLEIMRLFRVSAHLFHPRLMRGSTGNLDVSLFDEEYNMIYWDVKLTYRTKQNSNEELCLYPKFSKIFALTPVFPCDISYGESQWVKEQTKVRENIIEGLGTRRIFANIENWQ